MPCLNISTNVNLDDIDVSSIHSEATIAVSNLLGRPDSHMMVVLKGSVYITFDGTNEAAAYGELMTIVDLNPDLNKNISAAIASILETKLSIPKSRFILKFHHVKGSDCGWNGSTVHFLN